MTQLTKEYFDKQLEASDQRVMKHVDKRFEEAKRHTDTQFDDVNQRTARAFTGVQEQLNGIQRQLNDANLPQIKRDHKLLKSTIGLSA